MSKQSDQVSIPVARGVRIAARKHGVIALDKPTGVRSHPNKGATVDESALLLAPYDPEKEYYALPDGRHFYLLNRLDAPTSGLVLLTSDAEAAKTIKARFATQDVQKTYYALVFGRAGRLRTTWRDRLITVRKGGLRTMTGRGDQAITEVRAVAEGKGRTPISLLELKPHTGRTHQLRVQCAERRLPIIGDATYGDFAANRRFGRDTGIKRLCLHSARVRVQLDEGNWFQSESQIPEEFTRALGNF